MQEKRIEEVRVLLVKAKQDSNIESLQLVDSIQRLGLCYLFRDEIEAILRRHYSAGRRNDGNALFEASLRFRLLRQHGYEVVADDFFGDFLRAGGLVGEMRGVMAMHEASHLNMGGEEILYEAAMSSTRYLNQRAVQISLDGDDVEAKMAKHCLVYPQHKNLDGYVDKNYLHFLNGENCLLRELAEFEFSNTEALHKQEILRVVEWWKGVGLNKELKSSRNEPIKWHLWSMATLRNPSWSKHRILLTRPISLVYIVDDIFDVYNATIQDLTHFTLAVNRRFMAYMLLHLFCLRLAFRLNGIDEVIFTCTVDVIPCRWDSSAADELPSYMKACFDAIYETTNEICSFVCREHGWNPIHFLIKEWGKLMDAFLVEAKWLRSGEMAKAEEYLKNGVMSSGVPMVLSHLFFLMGNPFTNQTYILLNDPHGLTHSVAKLLRLLDDLGSAQDEQQEGYDGSYVDCCMKEGKVESREAAREHVRCMVSETWENINRHGLSSAAPFSASFRLACLNAARMVPTMYTYDENHRLPLLQQYVQSMFRDPTFAKSIMV